MGNDNKIIISNEQRHKEVLLFLNDELNRLQTSNSADSYDLEKEYAKTKKNIVLQSVNQFKHPTLTTKTALTLTLL